MRIYRTDKQITHMTRFDYNSGVIETFKSMYPTGCATRARTPCAKGEFFFGQGEDHPLKIIEGQWLIEFTDSTKRVVDDHEVEEITDSAPVSSHERLVTLVYALAGQVIELSDRCGFHSLKGGAIEALAAHKGTQDVKPVETNDKLTAWAVFDLIETDELIAPGFEECDLYDHNQADNWCLSTERTERPEMRLFGADYDANTPTASYEQTKARYPHALWLKPTIGGLDWSKLPPEAVAVAFDGSIGWCAYAEFDVDLNLWSANTLRQCLWDSQHSLPRIISDRASSLIVRPDYWLEQMIKKHTANSGN